MNIYCYHDRETVAREARRSHRRARRRSHAGSVPARVGVHPCRDRLRKARVGAESVRPSGSVAGRATGDAGLLRSISRSLWPRRRLRREPVVTRDLGSRGVRGRGRLVRAPVALLLRSPRALSLLSTRERVAVGRRRGFAVRRRFRRPRKLRLRVDRSFYRGLDATSGRGARRVRRNYNVPMHGRTT